MGRVIASHLQKISDDDPVALESCFSENVDGLYGFIVWAAGSRRMPTGKGLSNPTGRLERTLPLSILPVLLRFSPLPSSKRKENSRFTSNDSETALWESVFHTRQECQVARIPRKIELQAGVHGVECEIYKRGFLAPL